MINYFFDLCLGDFSVLKLFPGVHLCRSSYLEDPPTSTVTKVRPEVFYWGGLSIGGRDSFTL